MKRYLLIVFLVIFFTEQALLALRLPGAVISTTVEASSVQMAAGEPQLHCGHDGRGVVGCWNREKYEEWARKNGKLEDYRSSRNDGKGLTDYQRQRLLILGPTRQAPPIADISIQETTTLHDPVTGSSFYYNLNSSSGASLKAEVATITAGAVSAYLDFEQRTAQYTQVQKMYQDFYNRAAQQNAAIATQMRMQAAQIGAVAEAQKAVIFPNMALTLAAMPMNNLSRDQLAALKKAREMASSSLAHKTFEMNEVARQDLEKKFSKAVAEKDYEAVFEGVEPLVRGIIDGKPLPFDSAGVINKEGVVNLANLTQGKLAGPFDTRSWQTPKEQTEGEIVRRLANKFQRLFVESNGLRVLKGDEKARFVMGQMALGLGDQNLAQGFYERGSSFLAMANTLAESLSGMVYGAGEGLYELAKSIPEVALLVKDGAVLWWKDPVSSWGAVMAFAQSLPELAGMLPILLTQKYQEFQGASDFFRGKMVGRALFDLVMTVGVVGEVKVVQSLGTAGRLEAMASKVVPGSLKTVIQDEAVLGEIAQAARPVVKAVEGMPAPAREGLVRYARNSPEVAVELARAKSVALAQGEVVTSQFIDKMMASRAPIRLDEVNPVAKAHAKLMKELPQAPSAEFSGVVSRGIKKGEVPDGMGGMRSLSEVDVLELSPTNSVTEHRFSIGGDLGEKAQYFVIGGAEKSKAAIITELGVDDPTQILFNEINLNSIKVLDTTQPAVTDIILKSGIINMADPIATNAYNYTQALGSAVRSCGFQGMIVQSGHKKGLNLVIFK